jgi:FHS family glucose/mannose:H+ symporter-like MFS transporter
MLATINKKMNRKDNFKDYLVEIPNFLSIFVFAFFFMVASPMLIDIAVSTDIDIGNLSLIFTFYTIGAVIGQLTSVLYNRKFRKLHVIIASYIITILFIVFLSFSNNLYLFYVFYILIGYLLGVIWIQANEYILESKIKNKDRITTIALSFYPVGAFAAPLVASSVIRSGLSWRFSYYAIIFIISVTIILYLSLIGGRGGRKVIEEKEKVRFKEIFTDSRRNMIFLLITVSIVFYCASETVVSTWSPTFFRNERMFDIQTAGLVISIFWISVIIGRAVVSSIAGKVRSSYVMLGLSAAAIISMIFMIFLKSRYAIFIAMSFTGLGFSGMFPLLISSGCAVYKKGKGVLITILFAASNIGISVAPFLTRFTSRYNITFSISLAIIFMFLAMLLLIVYAVCKNKIAGTKIIINDE